MVGVTAAFEKAVLTFVRVCSSKAETALPIFLLKRDEVLPGRAKDIAELLVRGIFYCDFY